MKVIVDNKVAPFHVNMEYRQTDDDVPGPSSWLMGVRCLRSVAMTTAAQKTAVAVAAAAAWIQVQWTVTGSWSSWTTALSERAERLSSAGLRVCAASVPRPRRSGPGLQGRPTNGSRCGRSTQSRSDQSEGTVALSFRRRHSGFSTGYVHAWLLSSEVFQIAPSGAWTDPCRTLSSLSVLF